jgi:hypothetical protein
MLRQGRVARWGYTAAVSFIAAVPLLTGAGCPGPVEAVDTTLNGSQTAGSSTGNVPPSFSFTSPEEDIAAEIGDVIQITWSASDPDSNASIQLVLDPDGDFGNGNERTVLPLVLEDSGTFFFNLDTQAQSLPPAAYRVIARVNDGINPELIAVAPGQILLYGKGLLPVNASPSIITTLPNQNIGASQNDQVDIAFCGRDRDDGPNGVIPDIVVLLDLDSDPNSDLKLSGPAGEATLSDICFGGLPRSIPGAIVVGCFKDNDCQDAVNAATPLTVTIDVGLFPPTPSGDPYRVRSVIWDHVNAQVSSYAPGGISITAAGSGLIDLVDVGRSISGMRMQGFDTGGRAGSNGVGVGDIDQDGVDDFVVVERFGETGSASGNFTGGGVGGAGTTSGGNLGTAHLIFGSTQKFGGQISLNSVSVTVRGSFFTMYGGLGKGGCQVVGPTTVPGATGGDGLYSISRVGDVDGDGRPEILFGLPLVEQFFDYVDDDPCDCGCPMFDPETGENRWQGCYFDGLPNPWSEAADCSEVVVCGEDYMGSYDFDEITGGTGPDCTNDLDLVNTPRIDGGYAILVGGTNWDPNGFDHTNDQVALNLVGQRTFGKGTPIQYDGARWRGPWMDEFDLSQTTSPFTIIPDNRFGETVNSMPDMLDTRTEISPLFGPTLLISAPNGASSKGLIHMLSGGGQDWTIAGPDNSLSFPYYDGCAGQCGDFAIMGRGLFFIGGDSLIIGAEIGDHLGYAAGAGDYNLDGSRDVLAGAPGASRVVNGRLVERAGIVYVLFGRRNFGGFDLGTSNPPRMEIRGTNDDDQIGLMNTLVGDVNQDGLPDVAFASQFADGPGGADVGFIGIVFGGRQLTGENIFTVNQVGTAQLPGCKIYGAQPGGHAGATITNVGDFNGDSIDDLLISATDETMVINGQTRRGLAYMIFGGPHLNNASLNLSQVGSAQLPGAIFVTPYVAGSADDAPIDSVASAGDVNADGFADVLIGVSRADLVNALEPGQRRVDSGEMYLIYGSNTGSNNTSP